MNDGNADVKNDGNKDKTSRRRRERGRGKEEEEERRRTSRRSKKKKKEAERRRRTRRRSKKKEMEEEEEEEEERRRKKKKEEKQEEGRKTRRRSKKKKMAEEDKRDMGLERDLAAAVQELRDLLEVRGGAPTGGHGLRAVRQVPRRLRLRYKVKTEGPILETVPLASKKQVRAQIWDPYFEPMIWGNFRGRSAVVRKTLSSTLASPNLFTWTPYVELFSNSSNNT